MVATGRRSGGCANCRQSKKGCDQKRPTCGRCARLQRACYGYEEDETKRRSSILNASNIQSTVTIGNPGDPDQILLQRFCDHFCAKECEILEQFTHDQIVHDLMVACALVASSEKGGMDKSSTNITMLYARALGTLREALADHQRMKEDETLAGVIMICIFERINPLESPRLFDWSVHFQALAHIVGARGFLQIRTKRGQAIFRLARRMILDDAIRRWKSAPYFVISYTQALKCDSISGVGDKLAILTARLSIIREQFKIGGPSTENILTLIQSLREDLESFGCQEIATNVIHARGLAHGDDAHNNSYILELLDLPTRTLSFRSILIEWKACLGLTMELEDTITYMSVPQPAYLRFRQSLALTISQRATCLLHLVTVKEPPKGWFTTVLHLVGPLYWAGLWLQKGINPCDGDGREDAMAPFSIDQTSVQLNFIVRALADIADKLYDHYAKEAVDLLAVTSTSNNI